MYQEMTDGLYNSYVEVDRAALDHSFARIRAHIGPQVGVIPVLKSNAYGHGLPEMGRYFALRQRVELIAVSQLIEGVALRRAGLGAVDVLIVGALLERQLPAAVAYDLQCALFTVEAARALSHQARMQGKTARAQIKIETGMGRFGVLPGDDLQALMDEIATLGNIEITGLFTHFSTAETVDDPYAHAQHGRFLSALSKAAPRLPGLRYIHCCNTGAANWFRAAFGTHIRVGCMALGLPSTDDYTNPLGLREALSWRAAVTHIHDLGQGESCGYGRHFVAQSTTRVAVINVGYGDGLQRQLASQGGPVLLGDTRTRFLAACMDASMVDATGIPCAVGDAVTLIGTSPGGACLSITELARLSGQPYSAPLVSINHRVARRYIN